MLKRLLLTILFFAALGVIGFLMLPFALNRYVLPPILENAGFSDRQATITRISPYRINASLEFGSDNQSLISLPRIELRFSPRALWHRKIDELIIDHGEINLLRQGNRLVLATMSDTDADSPIDEAKMNLFLLPISVERITFKHCTILVHDPLTQELGVGFNGRLEPEFQSLDQAQMLQSLSGTFEFFNDIHARISVSARFGKDRHTIQAQMDRASLSLPPEVVPAYLQGLKFSELLAELNLNLEAGSLSLLDYRLDGELRDPHYTRSTLSLQGADPQKSAHFSLSGSAAGHRFELESIAMQTPFQAVVSVNGKASYPDGTLQAAGQLQANLGAGTPVGNTSLPLRLSYEASGSSEKGYDLHISGGLASTQPLAMPGNLTIFEPANIALSMDIKSDQDKLKADFSIASPALAISRKARTELRLKTSDLKVAGYYQYLNDSSALLLKGTASRVSAPDHQTELRGISFELPLDPFFSPPSKVHPGILKVSSITFEGKELFALAATTEQVGSVFNLKGDLRPLFPSGPELHFTGSANKLDKSASLTWAMPKTAVSDKTLPALSLLPVPANLHFDAELESSGTASYDEGRLGGSLRAAISNAALKINDKNVSISGIDCAVSLPRLPDLVSEPSQHCSIRTIAVSNLQFSDAELVFRVEDPNHLFIEKSRFSWCGGSLESGSLRLSRQNPDFNTTLYCSRIRLADLLTQFGFRGTEGEGSVNGRLPVRMSANRLEIDDGFLFSTPGTGGIVRFSETDKLRQGIGAVSQTVYINYSLMALEDFTYNWAKLSFNSRDADLLMTLELDGKPSTALPFGFKKGTIVETDKGEGLQYPIRLDVNFRLPLAELFQVGQTINSIMGKN